MKKRLSVIVAVLFATLFMGVSSVKAYTVDELKSMLTNPIQLDGSTITVSNDKKVLVDKYLNEHKLTEKEINYIYEQVSDVRDTLKTKKELTTEVKDEIKATVADISANTSVKATLNKSDLVVYNTDGSVFAKVSNPVKQTGLNMSLVSTIALVAFAITLVGAGYVLKGIKASK